jgi:hypothetical protein
VAEAEVQNNALSGVLMSSLNVELVYILLESITTFSKRTSNLSENQTSIITQMKNDAAAGNKYQNTVVTSLDESAANLDEQVKIEQAVERVLTLHEI